jgi:NTE family protein
VEPVRRLARVDIDTAAVRRGGLSPFSSVGDQVARAYDRHLFDGASLQDLPDRPRFVFNATNVGSGVLARFSKPQLADWRVGRIQDPRIQLAVAVACSSAFPPFLSPYRLDLRGNSWVTDEGNDLAVDEHRDEWLLTDGGVYDNLGIETAWKQHRTVLVSDAGGRMPADADPDRDWGRHLLRVLKTVDAQVRALRKRQVVEAYRNGSRDGAYLGIRTDIRTYGLADPLPAPFDRTTQLAEVPTRLAAIEEPLQERLIDWGYAVCDAGLRSYVDPTLPRGHLPYDSGV